MNSNADYLRVIEQTDSEKLEMYLKNCTKEDLAMMLIQANKEIEMLTKNFNKYSNNTRSTR